MRPEAPYISVPMDLTGSLAVVTGATEGIGRATAFALGRAGARVAICARTEANVHATARDLKADGIDAIGMPWTLPLGEISGVFMSAWASIQITPSFLPPIFRKWWDMPEIVPMAIE